MRRLIVLVAILATFAASASAWEVRLDLDNDGDPATINELTYATSVVVKVVLLPTVPHEEILGTIAFGLGGSCRECDGGHQYGVGHDLFDGSDGNWCDHPGFTGEASGVLMLECPADPGYHVWFTAVTVVLGGYYLDAPIFLAEFNAWVTPPVLPYCDPTPANLAAMHHQGEGGWWNYVQLGGSAVAAEATSWGVVKGLYD